VIPRPHRHTLARTSKALTHLKNRSHPRALRSRRPDITRRRGPQPECCESTKARRSDLERPRRASKRAAAASYRTATPPQKRRGAHETLAGPQAQGREESRALLKTEQVTHKYYHPPPSGFPARARRVCCDPPGPPQNNAGLRGGSPAGGGQERNFTAGDLASVLRLCCAPLPPGERLGGARSGSPAAIGKRAAKRTGR
jgi:hypothetical protein